MNTPFDIRTFPVKLNYSLCGSGVNLHNQRFGEVTQFNADAAPDQTFGARSITDLDLSYWLLQPPVGLVAARAGACCRHPGHALTAGR